MSNGTTQEKATTTPKLRDVQQERQLQLAADRQKAEELRLQVEQAPKLELSQQQELTIQHEQKRSRGRGVGM